MLRRAFCLLFCFVFMLNLCGCADNNTALNSAAASTTATPEQTSSSTESSAPDVSSAVSISSAVSPTDISSSSTVSTPITQSAQSIFDNMSLSDKVSQLFFVFPETLGGNMQSGEKSSTVTQINSNITAFLDRYTVGGVVFFAANINTPKQTSAFTQDLQSSSKIPLAVCLDEEGGRVARIANNASFNVPKFESMLSIGNSGNTDNAFNVGKTIGEYLTPLGFNLTFAPVADVFTNQKNTVIGDRAFSNDPNIAANMAVAAMNGFKSKNIISCIKHFPGHGDTTDDTHSGTVFLNKTLNELYNCELVPFVSAISNGAELIMTAHITVPEISGDTPVSLSFNATTTLLRETLGFDGVIVTDSLSMKAITNKYSAAQSALAAFNAGADILLLSNNFVLAHRAILSAVENGQISQSRLDESVIRILALKEKYGIL